MSENGVTEDGFERKTFTEIVDDIENAIKNRLGDDIYLGKESPLKHIIDSVGFEIAKEWDVAEHMYSSGYIDEASGANLEKICSLASVRRQPATFSEGKATFGGDDETNPEITEGFNISTDDDIVFETTESGKIGDDGTVTLEIQSTQRGSENNVAASTIVNLEDEKSGVFTVTNNDPTYGGEDKEDDAQLRLRTKNSLQERGNATLNAIEQRLLDYEGITAVSIDEHSDEVLLDITIGGLGEFKGTDTEDEIHDLMDGVRAYGVEYNLYEPTQVDVQVGGDTDKVVVKVEPDYPDEAKNEIKTNIYQHISSLTVGEDLLYAKIYDVIYNTGEWIYNVDGLQLGLLGGALSTDDITVSESNSERTNLIDSTVNEDELKEEKHDADSETGTTTWDSGDSIPFDYDVSRNLIVTKVEREDGSELDESYYTVDYDTDEAVEIDEDTGEQYLYITYSLSDTHIVIEEKA